MKAAFLLSIAGLLATLVNAMPAPEAQITTNLEKRGGEDIDTLEFAECPASEVEVEVDTVDDLNFEEEEEDEIDPFTSCSRQKCLRRCWRLYRRCRKHGISSDEMELT